MIYSNSAQFIRKNKWLFTLVLMLGFLFYLSSYFQSSNSQGEIVAGKIERVYLETEKSFDQPSEEISVLLSKLSQNQLFNINWLKETPEELGFLILIKKNDSLIFWNSNLVDAPDLVANSNNPIDTVLLLNNGYYQTHIFRTNDYDVYLLSLVYSDFAYQNAYLENKFSDRFCSESSRFTFLSTVNGEFLIRNHLGEPIFSIVEDTNKPANITYFILLLFVLIIWISIINILLIRFIEVLFIKRSNFIGTVLAVLGLVIMRIFPEIINAFPVLYSSDLFNASFFSFGSLFPSLGDLILNVQLGLFIAVVIAKNTRIQSERSGNLWILAILFLIFAIIACLDLNLYFVEQILFHSSIPLTFNSLYGFNLLSYILLFVLMLLSISFFVVIYRLSKLVYEISKSKRILSIIILSEIILNQLLISYFIEVGFLPSIFLVFYFFMFFLFQIKPTIQNRFVFFIMTMALFSAMLTMMFYKVNQSKSDTSQMLTAYKLGLEKDPMFEFLYADLVGKIARDTLLPDIINSNDSGSENTDQLVYNYLKENYLVGYFERYNTEITICGQTENLNIQPENYVINCNEYFENIIETFGKKTDYPSLFYIEDNSQGTYYIAQLTVPMVDSSENTSVIFLEFYFKYIPEGLGYPELLVDERKGFSGDFSSFSFAKYKGEILVYKFGDFLYPSRLNDFGISLQEFTDKSDFRHFTYSIDDEKTLIVSKPVLNMTEIIAPFSLFFFLLLLCSLLIYVFIFMKEGELRTAVNFRLKLQIFIFTALTFSFAFIGATSIAYIRGVYTQKNVAFLNERTQSILIELQQKLKNERIDDEEIQEYLHQLLLKFSLIFFSDINLYSIDGKLLGSSRPEIFANGLVSRNMNQEAFRMMHFERSLFYLQQESIGKGSYYSSYIPFRDADGNPSAYINLPYFARETELRDEISGFVLAYMNIFLALTAISVAFALVLSRRLTKPLMMIQDKMKTVRIDKVNEKIQWDSKDELGQLVSQYNQLIDELALSAGLLARSERETAWREMAQQVAHEIKNPLTPMRLSVQYLKRAWDENDPDVADKLHRTTRTLIEQIDTLSEIASAFSDFAKMPVNKPERIDLFVVLQNVVTLFENEAHVDIKLINKTAGETFVFADTKNLNRAFNNLIKNSIQAVGNKPDGFVEVTMDLYRNFCRISISDNGIGMTDEEKDKIFTPKFTTKSSGMGIGLSIVHNIISASKGKITFESGHGKGTTFTILLPIVK
jgi:signal transduction histidine kinase/MFS family permease